MSATATIQKNRNRISLYKYVQGIAYVSGVALSDMRIGKGKNTSSIDEAIMGSSDSELNHDLIQLLASKLNVSKASLKEILAGNQKPFNDLITVANTIGEGEKLEGYLHSLPTPQVPLSGKAKAKRKASKPKTKRKIKVSAERTHLSNYIKALAFVRGMSLSKVASLLGMSRSTFHNDIVRVKTTKPTRKLFISLQFVLHTDTKTLNAVLDGDVKPLKELAKRYLESVTDTHTLFDYISVLLRLNGTTTENVSRKLGKRGMYLKEQILLGNEKTLSPIFDKVSKMVGVNNADLKTALTKANLKVANHAYRPHMQFYVSYKDSPIGYHEVNVQYNRDKHFANFYTLKLNHFLTANKDNKLRYFKKANYAKSEYGIDVYHFQAHVRKYVAKIMSRYSNIYNFDYHLFLNHNFKNFFDDDNQVYVMENRVWVPIKDTTDWVVILYQIHRQLQIIRDEFNDLGSLQKDKKYNYAPYINIRPKFDGELSDPKQHHFNEGLAQLKDKQYVFFGKYFITGLEKTKNGAKKYNNDFYKPLICLRDIYMQDKEGYRHPVANRVWFNYGKQMVALGQLRQGDVIKVKAHPKSFKVGEYTKHTVPVKNYTLEYPSTPILEDKVGDHPYLPVPQKSDELVGYCLAKSHSSADFWNSNYQYIKHCEHAYDLWNRKLQRKLMIKQANHFSDN